ncbi:MAG: hypothetical protein VX265_02610 [Myxococcota bacterium]|nr:hypothetical protein [Myxococcota bacterium]
MLVSLFAAMPVVLAADPVAIAVVDGPQPVVRVTATGEPVQVPACRGVVWERYDAGAGRYESVPLGPCGSLAPALTLDKEGTLFPLAGDVAPAQVVRAVVIVGQGCLPDKPFPLARCEQVTAVRGPTVTVRAERME